MRLGSRITLPVLALGICFAATGRAQQPATTTEYPGLQTGKMWTFDAPPLDYWARRYNFHPTQAWLDHARLSAVRIPGCTASFVSPDGLIMSNHHCARGCADAVTRPGEDFLANGFYAPTRAEERACPNFTVDQLVEITDVTAAVNGAAPAGATAERASAARDSATDAIQSRCEQGTPNSHCEVIDMYHGGQYKLYRFHRWTEARLVFVPETDAASFGGDPDNFTYPRHDMDVSFIRVYENGQPAKIEHYYRWSRDGSKEGDLVFVVGNPGNTSRLMTIAQLEYLRDIQYPAILAQLNAQVAVFQQLARLSPERARAVENTIFYLQNSQKAYIGYQAGLLDNRLLEQKRAWERDFRARVDANPDLKRQYGAAWDDLARIKAEERTLDVRSRYYGFAGYRSRLLNMAGALVRLPVETAKPDSARLPAYQDANRPNLERMLASPAPIDTTQEIALLTAYFTAMARELPATDPVRRAALGGRSPADAVRAMVAATTIGTAEQRHALLEGGSAAVAASDDPFIKLARVIDPLGRPILKRMNTLQSQEEENGALVARALLAVFGNTVAPDATFSLRISDGEVARYPYNGTFGQPYTTFYGLYDRSFGFAQQAPWNLAPRWLAARTQVNLATPLNGVSTNDITGGNSGSPLINRDGEIVGLIFDGNIEQLPLDFIFLEATGRSVWVDSRGIVEALRHVYDAGTLADELARGNQ
ncbi:MAG TPA: S46 family peptidase [Gemmatimonadales bacterium]|nr:S46 family peptidase [Gemmatimonadales bacterium]